MHWLILNGNKINCYSKLINLSSGIQTEATENFYKPFEVNPELRKIVIEFPEYRNIYIIFKNFILICKYFFSFP